MKPSSTAVMCALSIILGLALPAFGQDAEAVGQAREAHQRAIEAFREGRYSEAIRLFERAEQLVHEPDNLWNIMRCHEEAGDYDAALRALDNYEAAPDLTDGDRRAANERRRRLQAARDAAEPPSSEPEPAQPPSTEPTSPPDEPPSPPEPLPDEGQSLAGPWAVLSSGLGLMLFGGGLYIAAYARFEAEGQEPFGTVEAYDEWTASYMSLAIAGDVLMGVGAAAAIGGLIWLLVARSRRGSTEAAAPGFSFAAGRDGLMLRAGSRF